MKKESGSCQTVLSKVLGTTTPGKVTAAMKWGLQMEDQAKEKYALCVAAEHQDFKVTSEVGLVVSETHPHIRVSPDGFIECRCHGSFLLEVKCPYNARDMSISDAMAEGKLPYLTKDGEIYSLKNGPRGYYAQVRNKFCMSV